jgi:hypothetical protein
VQETTGVPFRGRLKTLRDFNPANLKIPRPNPMHLQHALEFLGRGHAPMMPLLIVDIPHRCLNLRNPDRERAISVLPVKRAPLQMIVDPLRRAALDQLDWP